MSDLFALDLHRVVNPQPGWYGGDFHCHTYHSDGALSAPELAEEAKRQQEAASKRQASR